MGSWGDGVFENDHALDLYVGAIHDLIKKLEDVLNIHDASWDDIEGPLIYVRLLAVLHREKAFGWIARARAEGWKQLYLDIYDCTIDDVPEGPRRDVIVSTFDQLIVQLPQISDAEAVASKKPVRKRTAQTPSASQKAKKIKNPRKK